MPGRGRGGAGQRKVGYMSAKKRQKKRSGGLLINSVSAIIICVALALGISVFFRVSVIEVRGSSHYSADEIIEASGIKEGSSLVFMNRESAGSRISGTLVYIGRVTVSRKLPNTVVIQVQETGTVACVETESGLWLIDYYCRLLEECPLSEVDNYIRVTGFSALSPKAGTSISVTEEDKSKVIYLEDLLTALYNADMLREVNSIDMSTSGNPQFSYLGRFRVKLGKKDNTEAKLSVLKSAVAELDESVGGVMDLSDLPETKKAHFSPE